MLRLRLSFVMISLAIGSAPLGAADLTKIDRAIPKEPIYQGKPKYCLLVFGPKAEHRVWLAMDGDVLYVDRNGNGDLTEEGERYQRTVGTGSSTFRQFHIDRVKGEGYAGTIRLIVRRRQGAFPDRIRLELHVDGAMRRVAGFDEEPDGPLLLADRPDAPVVHLDGPLTMKVRTDVTKVEPGRRCNFLVYVGTPGLGQGSWTGIVGGMAPHDACPIARIELPPKKPEGGPIAATGRLPLL